jgi:RimJ/RimL family protein N-acetyltransferase
MRAWIYFEKEWNPKLLQGAVPETIAVVAVCAAVDAGENERADALRRALSARAIAPEDALLIAASDNSIRAARQLQLPVTAYFNPLFPGQSFAGVRTVIEGFDEVGADFLERIYERERGIPWVIARTKRCIIRELALSDLPALTELYAQPGITRGQQGFLDPLRPPEEERAYEEAYIANMYGYYGYGMWLVTEKETGRVIGRAGLEHRDFGDGIELELGYLIDPRLQRQGIATEVCRAILAFAGEHLAFPRINAVTDASNAPSIALLRKLHFSYLEDISAQGRALQRYAVDISG